MLLLACRLSTRRSFCSGESGQKRRVPGRFNDLLVAHGGQLTAGDDLYLAGFCLAVDLKAKLPGNGSCRKGMIAGDHLHLDAGILAGLDGGDRLRARRVDHTLQSQPEKAFFYNGIMQ